MEILPQLLAVLAVFALMGLTLLWLRKSGAAQIGSVLQFRGLASRNRSQPKILQRVDSLQLSPTHSLSLVRMADRAILIGTSPAGFHLVESSSWKTLHAQTEASQ